MAFPSEQGDIVSCSIYADDAAARSADQVRGWVKGNLQGIMRDTPTETFSGTVGMHAMVAPQRGSPAQSLYCLVRKSEGVPTDGSQRPNVEEMLAAAQKSHGFRGAYFARSAVPPVMGHPSSADDDPAGRLLGVCRLTSCRVRLSGETGLRDLFGPDPLGDIIFTSERRIMTFISL